MTKAGPARREWHSRTYAAPLTFVSRNPKCIRSKSIKNAAQLYLSRFVPASPKMTESAMSKSAGRIRLLNSFLGTRLLGIRATKDGRPIGKESSQATHHDRCNEGGRSHCPKRRNGYVLIRLEGMCIRRFNRNRNCIDPNM